MFFYFNRWLWYMSLWIVSPVSLVSHSRRRASDLSGCSSGVYQGAEWERTTGFWRVQHVQKALQYFIVMRYLSITDNYAFSEGKDVNSRRERWEINVPKVSKCDGTILKSGKLGLKEASLWSDKIRTKVLCQHKKLDLEYAILSVYRSQHIASNHGCPSLIWSPFWGSWPYCPCEY